MARRKPMPIEEDNMLLEDEFGAAFLEEELAEVHEAEPLPMEHQQQRPQEVAQQNVEQIYEAEAEEEEDAQLAFDLYETETKLILKARVAGVNKNDIDLTLEDGTLTISGVLSSDDSDEITQYHLQECYWGKFYRQIKLPVPVKEGDESIDAVLDEGVLILTFIKEKSDSAKKIRIS